MKNPEIVIALYRPKAGKSVELDALVRKHYPTLREYGLVTERAPFRGRSSDGTMLEVFEWVSGDAARKAHDHPAVAKIWEAMAVVADFVALDAIPESKTPFPHFPEAAV